MVKVGTPSTNNGHQQPALSPVLGFHLLQLPDQRHHLGSFSRPLLLLATHRRRNRRSISAQAAGTSRPLAHQPCEGVVCWAHDATQARQDQQLQLQRSIHQAVGCGLGQQA